MIFSQQGGKRKSSDKIVEQTSCPVCPSSDAYTIYEDGHGYCYSCNYKHRGETTFDSIKNSLSEGTLHTPVNLPSDVTDYLPPVAKRWLDPFGFTPSELWRLKPRWSDKKLQLIFPIYVAGELVTYQARYFGDKPDEPKWKTVGSKTFLHVVDPWKDKNDVVVVEDVISAAKVSRLTNSVPLFGTSMHDITVNAMVARFKKAIIWLDPDAKHKALKLALRLAEAGLETSTVFSESDPKYYITPDIRTLLKEA